MWRRFLNCHGFTLEIQSPNRSLLSHLEHDFHLFLSRKTKSPDFRLIHSEDVSIPQTWKRLFGIGRAEFFLSPLKERRVRFFKSAWVDYRYHKKQAFVYCKGGDEAYEACYFAILSFLGESWDRKGLHRVHGLGIATDGKGVLFLAPSGTGKSTLALDLLSRKSIQLLSDDIPLVTKEGVLFSFPQRIALKEKPSVPKKYVRRFKRAQYGEKYVIGAAMFSGATVESAPLRRVVLMRRKAQDHCELLPGGRLTLFCALIRWLAIGHETPQIAELFLRVSPGDLASRFWIAASRLRCVVALTCRYGLSEFRLGKNRGLNVQLAEQILSSAVAAPH